MSVFDLDYYIIKHKSDNHLSQAYTNSNKYYILNKETGKFMVIVDGNIDWVDKPTDKNMFRDIFQPISIFLVSHLNQEDVSIQIQPIHKLELVLLIKENEWFIKKIKYVNEIDRYIKLSAPKQNTTSVLEEPTHTASPIQIKPILEDNPLQNLSLSWLQLVSPISIHELNSSFPTYLTSRLSEDDYSIPLQIHPSLWYLYWVHSNYDYLPNNILFLGSTNIELDKWPIHSEIEHGFSILDRKIRIRDGYVFDREGTVKDNLSREGSCELSIFIQHILKMDQKYVLTSSSNTYIIPKTTILNYPKSYFSSIWWRMKNNPTLYPGHFVDCLWGYLTTK